MTSSYVFAEICRGLGEICDLLSSETSSKEFVRVKGKSRKQRAKKVLDEKAQSFKNMEKIFTQEGIDGK